MRINLAGVISKTDPMCLVFTGSATFDKTLYPDYTNYDVIVIGAGGGRGGGVHDGTDTNHPTYVIRSYGGAGGGGGFHRVQGLLEFLPSSVSIVVGSPGGDGTDASSDSGTTGGSDGGHSSFGGFCIASGGKGGHRVTSTSVDENMECDGGNGGLGGITSAGHGGIGGIAGIVDPADGPAAKGLDGGILQGPYEYSPGNFTLEGQIGEGGGGGTGGIARSISGGDWAGHLPWASEGGRGSYNSDEDVFGPRGFPTLDPDHYMAIVAGKGGGARVTPLNRSTKSYGASGEAGVVAILLTKE